MTAIWFGTSGFSYKEWRPSFYPQDLSDKEFLKYYSARLNSVEIDYTFYRMPSAKTIDAWKAAPACDLPRGNDRQDLGGSSMPRGCPSDGRIVSDCGVALRARGQRHGTTCDGWVNAS